MKKEKLGILYICTGPYVAFWELFYKSFEKNFMLEVEKNYYVFTDADTVYGESESQVNHIAIEHKPWPLITLLRFHTFLEIEDRLRENDYLLFSNANLICSRKIESEEILPRERENFFFTVHPGYFKAKPYRYVYERGKKSAAYIPYNCGETYVIGAFYGGRTKAFLDMSRQLKEGINNDLKKNVIATWHDESHINRFIIGRNDVRLISPSYCYPCGFDINYEKVIYSLSKQSVFDINNFKGYDSDNATKSVLKRLVRRIGNRLSIWQAWLCYCNDMILRRKV